MAGFALTTLQRRLASSPEAIDQSLCRRRERLERRLREERVVGRGTAAAVELGLELLGWRGPAPEELAELAEIEDEAPAAELEAAQDAVADQASTARTIANLEQEIRILRDREALAETVRASGTDRKWDELSALLQDRERMFGADGHGRKLIIFTEHRDKPPAGGWARLHGG